MTNGYDADDYVEDPGDCDADGIGDDGMGD